MEQHRAHTRRDADVRALMERAVGVASTARLRSRPNPWVGAVIACADGRVFDGSTSEPGGPHAEIVALHAARAAGADTTGAVLVSTLEPCNHTGRTGPCTDAIIDSGIGQVVVGIEDPDSKVAGSGIRRLRDAGLHVETGVMADTVTEQLAPYLHHRRTGRPWVVLKMAVTLDSRTVAPAGLRWITGDSARRRVHVMRAESDAVVVGSGTVIADDPELTVRHVEGPSPRRIVMSRTGAVPAAARVQPCETWDGTPDALLDRLGAEGVLQVLVEGGPRLAASFHGDGLVNRYVFHVAPLVSGDRSAPGVFGPGPRSLDDSLTGNRLVSASVLGGDIELVLEPDREEAA